MKPFTLSILTVLAGALSVRCAEVDVDAEKKSYLPLIPESSYTYEVVFNERKPQDTVIVKSAMRGDLEVFFFVDEADSRNPDAIVSTNSFGLGLFVKTPEGIATLPCFFRNELKAVKKGAAANPVMLLAKVPEKGRIIDAIDAARTKFKFDIEGYEDVTVAAGTFKECLKLKINEIQVKTTAEKNVEFTSTVWLAKGVGVVKWIRGTGRVDELAAYKLAG